jgi:hypothetical protein
MYVCVYVYVCVCVFVCAFVCVLMCVCEVQYALGRVEIESLVTTERTRHGCVELVEMFIGKLQRPLVWINRETCSPLTTPGELNWFMTWMFPSLNHQ